MPSILIEVSYLSNTEDAKLLSQNAYRQQIAESIAEGIRNYTASLKRIARVPTENPPVGDGSQQPRN
jgi:N-acetylmuramoyl-L-alanine amidase